jgi:hypothetical protein
MTVAFSDAEPDAIDRLTLGSGPSYVFTAEMRR